MINKEIGIGPNLQEHDIEPSERLGQHFLTNEHCIKSVTEQVIPWANVIEVGVGPGNLTEKIAKHANKVIGYEVDARFGKHAERIMQRFPNVEINFEDVLKSNLVKTIASEKEAEWQIVSNLPFHISEPFLKQIAELPIYNAVLLVGNKLAERVMVKSAKNLLFTKTSLLAQTFFDIEEIMDVPKSFFSPVPGTDGTLLILTPKEPFQLKSKILRGLFVNDHTSQTVRRGIINAVEQNSSVIRSKKEGNRHRRRQTRERLSHMKDFYNSFGSTEISLETRGQLSPENIFKKMKLDDKFLNRPFNQLDNSSLRKLVEALDRI